MSTGKVCWLVAIQLLKLHCTVCDLKWYHTALFIYSVGYSGQTCLKHAKLLAPNLKNGLVNNKLLKIKLSIQNSFN